MAKILETDGPRGFSLAVFYRVRELADGEPQPERSQPVPAATEDFGWVPADDEKAVAARAAAEQYGQRKADKDSTS